MSTEPKIRQRFLTAMGPGGLGKSSFFSGVISWLSFAGPIPFSACDSDKQHQSLTKRNRGKVNLYDARVNAGAFQTLIQKMTDLPVVIVDFPAADLDDLLPWFEKFRVLDAFEAKGTRMTLPLFASNDKKAALAASVVVQHFGPRADYVLVENLGLYESDGFKKTPLYDLLMKRGTPTVRVPALTQNTLKAWNDLEKALGHRLSLDEACNSETSKDAHNVTLQRQLSEACGRVGFDWSVQADLQNMRNQYLYQLQEIAESRLVPDTSLIKNRVEPFPQPKTVGITDRDLEDALV